MKNTGLVQTAFSICIALSFLVGTLLLLNVKAIPHYTRMVGTGKQILEAVLEVQLEERDYLLYHQEDALDIVKEKIDKLRKLLSLYEKSASSAFVGTGQGFFESAAWEEAVNLYDRLFDQFVLYHRTVKKHISEIRDLEKSILAVIYSKMNPERGVIALQEVRIYEKGYLLYRKYTKLPEERSFLEMRKEAVANLLIWAEKDKRIEELMDKDNALFNEIVKNYEGEDNTLIALKRESRKIRNTAENFLGEGEKRLHLIQRRCVFLSTTLLIMWLVTAVAIVAARFRI